MQLCKINITNRTYLIFYITKQQYIKKLTLTKCILNKQINNKLTQYINKLILIKTNIIYNLIPT